MLPLTAATPKPLLQVDGAPLIEHHLRHLRSAGITQVVVNLAYLGEQIVAALGDGSRFDVSIDYSYEPYPLETAGALLRALPLLGDAPFVLVNGDVWTDYPFNRLANHAPSGLGHMVFVPNPPFKQTGDYSLDQGRVTFAGEGALTFAGISLLSPELLRRYPEPQERLALRPVLDWAISQNALSGEVFHGVWSDVGTPERLSQLNAGLQQ